MIKISKGLDLPISGKPAITITDEPKISSVSLLANDFVGMKPTMLVKDNDEVKAGQQLFEDKKNPGVFFVSPAGGVIKSINRGDKRKFLSIEIEISQNEDFVDYDMGNNQDDIKIHYLIAVFGTHSERGRLTERQQYLLHLRLYL